MMSDLPQGTVIRAIDKAGRILVRSHISERYGAVVLTYGLDGQILMLEPPAWDELKARLLSLSKFDSDAQDLRRFQIAPAQGCPIDSAGRVRVPEALRGYAGLDGEEAEAQILDLGDGELEIWAADKYNNNLLERAPAMKATMRRFSTQIAAAESSSAA